MTKKQKAKFFHKKAFLFSLVLAALLVIIGYVIIQFPYYTGPRILKFLMYSISLMYPVIITTGIGMILIYVTGIKMHLSDITFYAVSFLLYLATFYFLSKAYYLKRNKKDKKRLLVKILIGVGIFIILSIGYLLKSYYY